MLCSAVSLFCYQFAYIPLNLKNRSIYAGFNIERRICLIVSDIKERELHNSLFNEFAHKMNEDDALVLMFLYKIYKSKSIPDQEDNRFATVKLVIEETGLDKNKARKSLMRLELVNFLEKSRGYRSWQYAISEDGANALNYLLDKKLFPGRREKFFAILGIN